MGFASLPAINRDKIFIISSSGNIFGMSMYNKSVTQKGDSKLKLW